MKRLLSIFFRTENRFIHLIWGLIPSIMLFFVGIYYIRLYHNNKYFQNPNIFNSSFPISYLFLTFLIIILFLYLIFYSFILLKSKIKNEFLCIFLLIIICIPIIMRGPFFQPPSDPLFHAEVMWDFLEKNTFDQENKALILKSIFATFYLIYNPDTWSSRINLLLYFHFFSITILITSLYVSARLYGLNLKWAIFSVLVFVLFFGTNLFSYISYYSLAPSSINMSFIWVISALLFKSIFKGMIFLRSHIYKIIYIYIIGALVTPILYYNHKQEAAFLFFNFYLAGIIIIFNIIKKKRITNKNLLILIILSILFVPSSFLSEHNITIKIFNKQMFEYFSSHISDYGTPWYFGKLNGPRVLDTLGLLGFLPLVAILLNFIYSKSYFIIHNKTKNSFYLAMIPGLLPFWIILIPLNLIIWMKGLNMTLEIFWRFCYMTQFWISIGYIFYKFEIPAMKSIKRVIPGIGITN